MAKNLKTINSVLIANRGEIAVRIARTLRDMNITSIAVYSQADKNSLHVAKADQAILIGPAPAAQSYLSFKNIIKAAKSSGADAIHPGYGFLSENADFVRACDEAGIIFIGPSIEAMEIMGNKAHAKHRMAEIGVVCVPGYEGENQSDAAFIKAASEIGYPVMVKAAAGGGGRGMRLVEEEANLGAALQQARDEALSGFGSDELILEKAVTNAHHIEFQIFGDCHGNIIHLGERDCSLQRRHQKVIEEAPSPVVNAGLRQRMGEVAIKAAQSVSYEGAGTVEFLLDENKNFFFLEMNTRLQVEHPVTEMVTGLDLVEWQIRVARGEELPLAQDEVTITGHAIEARLYAEDPARGFLPSTGSVIYWDAPDVASLGVDGVRVDGGIESKSNISSHYDAMVAKIISHAGDRKSAISRLKSALKKTMFFGPDHNKEFLQYLLSDDTFVQGTSTTQLIGNKLALGHLLTPPPANEISCLAALIDFNSQRNRYSNAGSAVPANLLNWSSSPLPPLCFSYLVGDVEIVVLLEVMASGFFRATIDGRHFDIRAKPSEHNPDLIDANINGKSYLPHAWRRAGRDIYFSCEGRDYKFLAVKTVDSGAGAGSSNGMVTSSMHGILVDVSVQAGTVVTPDTPVATLEAMKMRHEILAGVAGVVKAVHQETGAQVSAGDLLFEIEEENPKNAAN